MTLVHEDRRGTGRWVRRTVVGLVLALGVAVGTVGSSQPAAAAVNILPTAARGLPLSLVSAGVSGGVFRVTPAGGIASAGIMLASSLGIGKAINSAFAWASGTPSTFGDVPTAPGTTTETACPGSTVWFRQTAGVKAISSTCPGSLTEYGNSNFAVGLITGPFTAGELRTSFTPTSLAAYGSGEELIGSTSLTGCNYNWYYSGGGQNCATRGGLSSVLNATQQAATCRIKILDPYGNSATFRKSPCQPAAANASGTEPLGVQASSTCSNGSTYLSAIQAITRAGTSEVPITYPACPAGTTRTGAGTSITRTSDGTVIGQGHDPITVPIVPSAYPECVGGGCVMVLNRVLPDGTTLTCTSAGMCDSYAEVVEAYPATGTGASTVPRQASDGSTYSCKFGPYAVAVAECTVIPGAGVPSPTPTRPTPIGGSGYSCSFGFSMNPVNWVIEPLKCLFIPESGTLDAAWTKVAGGFAATGLPAWAGAIGGIATGLAGFGGSSTAGCAGPHFSFTLKGTAYDFDPLDACSQPMQGVAVVVKLFATIAVVVAGARLCARPVLASIGMGNAT